MPWVSELEIIFLQDIHSAFAECIITEKASGESDTTIRIGVQEGLNIPVLAHEAAHAAIAIMRGNWKLWAPKWIGTRAQKEETLAWCVELIVTEGVFMAREHYIKAIAKPRNIY